MIKKKVLLVSPYFYPESGGLENYAFQVAKRLLADFDVRVVCAAKKGERRVEDIEGVSVLRLSSDIVVSNTPVDFSLKSELLGVVDEFQPDIIHAHAPVPYFADIASIVAKQKNIPFVLTFHNTQLKKGSWTDLIVPMYEQVLKKTVLRAHALVTVTKKAAHHYFDYYVGKKYVIHPGVSSVLDSAALYPERQRAFLFAGQISESHDFKGLHVLINMVIAHKDSFKDVCFYIVGSGDKLRYYQELVKKQGVEKLFDFAGKVSRPDLLKKMQNVLAVLIPSTSDVEGSPTVMFEAMSRGTPVIGARVGGIPDVVLDGENGFTFNALDVDALHNYVARFLEPDFDYGAMTNRCLRSVRDTYTWDSIAAKYKKVFSDLL